MTPSNSEIAKEAERALRFHDDPKEHEKYCKPGNIKVIEAAIEKARDLPDERWLAQQLHAANELCAALQEDTKRLDWLETNVADLLCRAESGEVVWLVYANLVEVGRGATPRAAIDAAMKGEISRDQR